MKWSNYTEDLREISRLKGETNDCTVKAWCFAFNTNYLAAHSWLKKHGRRDKCGMSHKQLKDALSACKKHRVIFGPYTRSNRITLSKFIQKHNVGRYYVVVKGHALAVVNGVVHDWNDSMRREVILAARIRLHNE